MDGNKLINITATHKLTLQNVDLVYYSIEQAKKYNPDFMDFRALGVANKRN